MKWEHGRKRSHMISYHASAGCVEMLVILMEDVIAKTKPWVTAGREVNAQPIHFLHMQASEEGVMKGAR